MARKYNKGPFFPRNPKKYKGNPNNIVYRSSWEFACMMKFDTNPNVIQWSSEEIAIPYRSPWDSGFHRYYPDFLVWMKEGKEIKVYMIEIKPDAQTRPPVVRNEKSKKYLTEVHTWGINDAKWKAARSFCAKRGWEFQILTEKELGVF